MDPFVSLDKLPLKELIKDGFVNNIQTENFTIAYSDLKAGAEIPMHHHPEEAADIILEGELEMQIGDKTEILYHGMISVVPSNVPHKAKAISDCKVVTVFYPKRKI